VGLAFRPAEDQRRGALHSLPLDKKQAVPVYFRWCVLRQASPGPRDATGRPLEGGDIEAFLSDRVMPGAVARGPLRRARPSSRSASSTPSASTGSPLLPERASKLLEKEFRSPGAGAAAAGSPDQSRCRGSSRRKASP
jgi:hypothetical protein